MIGIWNSKNVLSQCRKVVKKRSALIRVRASLVSHDFYLKLLLNLSLAIAHFCLLGTRTSRSVPWTWLCSLDCHQNWFFFSDFLREVRDSQSKKSGSAQFLKSVPKMTQKCGFWGFDKNLVYSVVLLWLEYEITNGLLGFCKNHMSRKNLVLELWFKNC